MSFDLYVFDLGDVPDDEEAIGDLLEDEELRKAYLGR